MTEPIEDAYFRWLCAKVLEPHQHNPNYHDLMRILHGEEFTWVVNGDHNRAEYGKELRVEFLRDPNIPFDAEDEPDWFDLPCSVLEMLIGFASQAEFQTDISCKKWFWEFLDNLQLKEFQRVNGARDRHAIEDIIDTFLNRSYRADGYGGILPMRTPQHDQRKVEIWQQFFEYLEDKGI